MQLMIMTLNLKDGGWDPERGDYRRLELLPELTGQASPDVVAFQEGPAFRADGQALRFRAEKLLSGGGRRSFLTRPQRGAAG